jgi:hypothetical protein
MFDLEVVNFVMFVLPGVRMPVVYYVCAGLDPAKDSHLQNRARGYKTFCGRIFWVGGSQHIQHLYFPYDIHINIRKSRQGSTIKRR